MSVDIWRRMEFKPSDVTEFLGAERLSNAMKYGGARLRKSQVYLAHEYEQLIEDRNRPDWWEPALIRPRFWKRPPVKSLDGAKRHVAQSDAPNGDQCDMPFKRLPTCACDRGSGFPPSIQERLECRVRGGPCSPGCQHHLAEAKETPPLKGEKRDEDI